MDISCSGLCLRGIIAALALSAAASAHAVVYKWVEEDDKVIYSNEPPTDPEKVRELTRIDDMKLVPGERNPELVPLEQRPRASAVSEAEIRSSAAAVAAPKPQAMLNQEPVTLVPREPAAAPREAEAPPQRVIPRSTHTGAVQDPCLVSPDPRCYEKNKSSYHPFAGYTPPAAPAAQPVGATSNSAGGTIGAQVSATPASSTPPPKRGANALPPGSAAPVSLEWSKTVR